MKKKWLHLFSIVGIASLCAPILVATSCSGSNTQQATTITYSDKKVSDLVNNYHNEYDKKIGDTDFFQYTDKEVPDLKELIDRYSNEAKILSYDNLSFDGKIWLNSFLDELDTKKELLESNIHYLIVDPWDNLAMTNYNYDGGIFDYVINTAIEANDDKTLERFVAFIQKVCKNLEAGLKNKITMSQMMLKHFIGTLLQQDFNKPLLNYYVEHNSWAGDMELKDNNLLLFKQKDGLSPEKVNAANKAYFEFLNYLTKDYYNGVEYGQVDGEKTYNLTKSETLTDKEDNGYLHSFENKNYYLNGLGLSDKDLDKNDIGLGFMKNKEYGQKIYNALLKKHSNTDQTAEQIFNLGNSGVAQIKNNMEAVAKTIAEIFVGKGNAWSPKGEYYDEDSSANEHKSELADDKLVNIVDAQGNVNLEKFFIWMNTDRWFNGRDMTSDQFPSFDGKTPIYAGYVGASNPNQDIWKDKTTPYTYTKRFNAIHNDIKSLDIADIIGWVDKDGKESPTKIDGSAGNLTYKFLVKGLSPSTVETSDDITNIQQTNSISPEAAWVGTSHAFEQYLQYKDVSAEHFNGMFKKTSIDFTLRTGTGGAAYANGGEGSWNYSEKGPGGFYLDSNPYFGLQKWSMSTLESHEAICGHVYQFNYAHDHPPQSYAPSFNSNAYAEGWGLFSEWLASEIGMYGKPVELKTAIDNTLQLPQFGVDSQNVDVTQFKKQYDYANGAYWIEDDKSTPDKVEEPGNSQKLFDATQYFGFLNERQLRAMRCAVDVGIHAGAATTSIGQFKPDSGWSLKQAREYLHSNSGLGIDDINRESKRYLEYSGQAVSYYNGLKVLENLFMTALGKYKEKNPNKVFLDYKNTFNTNANTANLFDVILRNGDVPIGVLKEAVTNYINNNY